MSEGKLTAPKVKFKITGHNVVVDVKDPNFKVRKISGTTLGALLNRSAWDTSFTVSCKLLGLWNEDLSNIPAITAGHVLEPKVIGYANALPNGRCKVIPASKIFPPRKGAHDDWAGDWDDEVFTGHIDGARPDGTIVEVKTTQRIEDWYGADGKDKIPEGYLIQASLYS
jgi:hypothetical protein